MRKIDDVVQHMLCVDGITTDMNFELKHFQNKLTYCPYESETFHWKLLSEIISHLCNNLPYRELEGSNKKIVDLLRGRE